VKLGTTQLPAHCVPVFFPRGYSARSVKLTTHLHPVPRLGMSGAIPLLPLHTHAFMACTFTCWNGIMQTNAGGMRHRHQSSLQLPAPQEPQTKYKIISYPSPSNCKSRYRCLGFPYTEIKRPRREVTTHLQPVLRLGVTGSIPLHTLYVFMAQTGPPSPLRALRGATRLIITQCNECEKAHYLAIIRAT
jgi:hypothetical protein